MRQQTALAALGSFALHADDFQGVLIEAARLCAEGTGAPFSKIVEFRPEQGDLILRAGVGWREGVVGIALAKADASTPVGRAFITGNPVINKDLRQAHDFALPPIYVDHDIVSSVNVLIPEFGVLEVDSSARRSFGEEEIVFLTTFANVIAATVNRMQRQRALQSLVQERGIFLRELQHRVRNHLHALAAMAETTAFRTRDEAAQRGIKEFVRRIFSLATLYDHLMGVELAPRIDLAGYLDALAGHVREFEVPGGREIVLSCSLTPVEIGLETATAIGIMVHELIANSLEHAFGEGAGRIALEMHRAGEQRLRIIVADDGTGMPSAPDGIGLDLVRRLVQQLDGRLELDRAAGTRWTVELPLP